MCAWPCCVGYRLSRWAIFCATFANFLRPMLIKPGADLALLVGGLGAVVERQTNAVLVRTAQVNAEKGKVT